jgi:hypothetical protein
MPSRNVRAIAYAVLIWITGFIWGSVVFMTPSLKTISSIPYVSRYPAISFPILITWPILSYFLAKSYLKLTPDKAAEGLKLGVVFAGANALLDLLVLVILLKAGFGYFASLTIWIAYTMLVIIPWITGRSMQTREAHSLP